MFTWTTIIVFFFCIFFVFFLVGGYTNAAHDVDRCVVGAICVWTAASVCVSY